MCLFLDFHRILSTTLDLYCIAIKKSSCIVQTNLMNLSAVFVFFKFFFFAKQINIYNSANLNLSTVFLSFIQDDLSFG